MLPKLRIEPLDPNVACKDAVVDLVSVLSSLASKPASRVKSDCKTDNSAQTATVSIQKIVQTSGHHLARCDLESLVGEWQSLHVEIVWRRSYLKCVDPVRTANAEGPNLYLAPEDFLRVVSQDADKNIQVVCSQHYKSATCWLLLPINIRYFKLLLLRSCNSYIQQRCVMALKRYVHLAARQFKSMKTANGRIVCCEAFCMNCASCASCVSYEFIYVHWQE